MLFFSLAFTGSIIYAQTNQWTYIKGDTIISQTGIYGTKGTPSANNKPGARRVAFSWTDVTGNLWLFGGSGDNGLFNDLWKFNPSTNEWTWMKGSDTIDASPVYGTKGTASPDNTPGARRRIVNWRDLSGNFWLFGGDGFAANGRADLNDLWKYDVLNNQWTWVSGDSTGDVQGVYGSKGVAAITNKPGGRYASQAWADTTGNLWLFSGLGAPNDLWKYNIAADVWTWVSGDSVDNAAVYGTQGVPAVANKPGSRSYGYTWTDTTNNLWLFGGGTSNDLWKYNTATNEWTWVKGDTISNPTPVYGVKDTSSILNTPGSRDEGITWTDATGNLWLFGGSGDAANGTSGALNDLWKYNIAANQWTWVSGGNTPDEPGEYGVQGSSSPTNKPGGRDQLVGWKDLTGSFWLFGGDGFDGNGDGGYMNDLWKYTAQNILPVDVVSFTGKLQGEKAELQWIIENEESLKSYEVERSFDGSTYNKINTIKATNARQYNYIDVSNEIRGKKVYYRLKKVDNDGRFSYSKVIVLQASSKIKLNIYPNPVTSVIKLQTDESIRGRVNIEIIDMYGKIRDRQIITVNGSLTSIPVTKLVTGTYYLKVRINNEQHSLKFIVNK